MNEEDANLQSLFSDLNQVSRGTIIRERAGGGTGGGSEIVEGSMDPNSLMIGNPYIAKNVVGFNQGGVLGGQAMSNPYLDKVNQLVGLQQMVNVGKGMMGKALMEEAVTDSLMAPPIAKHGMKYKYDEGGNIEITDKTTGETRRISSKSQEYKDLMPNWYNPDLSPLQNLMFNPYRPAVGEWHDTETGERGVHSSETTWGDIMPERFPNYVSGSSPSWWSMEDQYAPLTTPAVANNGMKRKYVNGGVYNEGGVADEEVVSKDTRLQDLLDKLRSKSTIFGQITPPRQSLAERTSPLREMWEKVRAGEIPATTMFNLTNYRPPVERNPLNPFGSTILGTTMQLPYWQELIDRRRQKAQDTLEQNYFNEMLLEQNRDVEFKKEGTPIANKGMKMKKRYTQGGRF